MAVRSTTAEAFAKASRTAKSIKLRSGEIHRFTAVWFVLVEGRIFVRTWNNKPTGWFRAFIEKPDGLAQLSELDVPVRAKATRSARIRKAVTAAFAVKYCTPGSRKWVTGFAEPSREANTLELIPRATGMIRRSRD